MTEIQNNYVYPQQQMMPMGPQNQPNQQNPYQTVPQGNRTVQDEFVSQHKKNGLVERLYNGIKNLTGLGIGSKKVQAAITKFENGEKTEEEARQTIDKYRKSQATSAQITGDALSIGASIGTFFGTKKYIIDEAPKAYLRKIHGVAKRKENDAINSMFKIDWNKLRFSEKDLVKYFKDPTKRDVKLGIMSLAAAGFTKMLFGVIDRIGSKEFTTDKKDFNGAVNPYDKAAFKSAKKYERGEKMKANFRNFASGAINGALLPITGLVGGIVGVPLYLVTNSLNRYFIGNHDEENKSFKNYVQDLKNDGLTHAALALGVGIPAFLKTHNLSAIESASREGVKALQNIKINKQLAFEDKTTYDEISNLVLNSQSIKDIIGKENEIIANKDFERLSENLLGEQTTQLTSMDELRNLAVKLCEENFFAAKFKQISKDNSALASILAENLPATRNFEAAQKYIDSVFGSGKYELDPKHYCLGVGTVAETYFAKNLQTGEEVCIKALKEGMNGDKIARDKKALLEIIEASKDKYSPAEITKLKNSVEDLASGVLKEIDLKNEFEAAEKLAKDTNYANVVKGIEVKNNVYVMERAKGISLRSLMDLNEAYAYRDTLLGQGKGNGMLDQLNSVIGGDIIECKMDNGSRIREIARNWKLSNEEKIAELDKLIEEIESKTPSHGNIKLEPNDLKNLIAEYQQVLVEQFNKISQDGKVMHGDIHPGNIFIDVDALKTMEGPGKMESIYTGITGKVKRENHGVFTLIDTGNIIELNQEQSLALLNLSSYIEHGNHKKIAEYVMQGVEGDALGGHTKEKATELVSEELKKYFFDPSYPLDVMTNDNVIKLTSSIMKKHGIVPNDTQLNLNKAIQSANNSYDSLVTGLFNGRLGNGDALGQLFGFGEGAKDGKFLQEIKKSMEKAQEKENLKHLSVQQRIQQKKMEGNVNPHQKEYHIYKLKQELFYNQEMPKSEKRA